MVVTPMLAVTGALPPGDGWAYELKWDGLRALAVVRDGQLRLYARTGAEITAVYPELAGLGEAVGQAVAPPRSDLPIGDAEADTGASPRPESPAGADTAAERAGGGDVAGAGADRGGAAGAGADRGGVAGAGAGGDGRDHTGRGAKAGTAGDAAGAVLAETVLDGELVVLDAAGRPSSPALAERMHVRDPAQAAPLVARTPVTYLIFDLLQLADEDLIGQAYQARRQRLESLGLSGPHWLVPPWYDDGATALAAAGEHGLAGVVAKRLASVYQPGVRSPDWVKVERAETDERVVGDYRPGR